MPNARQPRVEAVIALRPQVIRVTWGGGCASEIDLGEPVGRIRGLAPLLEWETFRRVQVGEWGWSIAWGDEIDLGADSLWRMAHGQTGEAATKGFDAMGTHRSERP